MKFKGIVVTFEEDVHEDDLRLDLFYQIRGVIDVRAVPVDVNDHMNRLQIQYDLERRIKNVLFKALRDE